MMSGDVRGLNGVSQGTWDVGIDLLRDEEDQE